MEPEVGPYFHRVVPFGQRDTIGQSSGDREHQVIERLRPATPPVQVPFNVGREFPVFAPQLPVTLPTPPIVPTQPTVRAPNAASTSAPLPTPAGGLLVPSKRSSEGEEPSVAKRSRPDPSAGSSAASSQAAVVSGLNPLPQPSNSLQATEVVDLTGDDWSSNDSSRAAASTPAAPATVTATSRVVTRSTTAALTTAASTSAAQVTTVATSNIVTRSTTAATSTVIPRDPSTTTSNRDPSRRSDGHLRVFREIAPEPPRPEEGQLPNHEYLSWCPPKTADPRLLNFDVSVEEILTFLPESTFWFGIAIRLREHEWKPGCVCKFLVRSNSHLSQTCSC